MQKQQQKEMDTQPSACPVDLYSLTPEPHPIDEQKRDRLLAIAKRYAFEDAKFRKEPFFTRQTYFILSVKWFNRWKAFVGYKEATAAVPLNQFFGCGQMPTGNEDILDNTYKSSVKFSHENECYNLKLKQGLFEGKDYIFISKELATILEQGCVEHHSTPAFYDFIRIPRHVAQTSQGKKVELYYFNLRVSPICNSYCKEIQHQKVTKFIEYQFQYSHYKEVSQLTNEVKEFIVKDLQKKRSIDWMDGVPIRVWLLPADVRKNILFNTFKQGVKANPTFSYKLYLQAQLLQSQKSLSEYDILPESTLFFQMRQYKENWLFYNSKNILEGTCNNCRNKGTLKFLCSCKYAAYCSKACKTSDKPSHKHRCPNQAESESDEEELKLTDKSNRGITGLRNLGNTCFMNSGLQCISHIKELFEYFLSNTYQKHINKENPLGTQGQLSTSFAKMIQTMWYGTQSSFSPTHLKRAIGKFQPMFSGYAQHDSGQLIGYLLDGLHQDLNRIIKKPYVESKDYDGRPDKVVAEQAWQGFLLRNKSIITDLMYGQFKSIVDCPKCQFQSIQFDPFLMCSLPIVNNNKKSFEVVFIKDHVFQTKVVIAYNAQGKVTMHDIMLEVIKKLQLKEDSKLIIYASGYSTCETIRYDANADQIRKEYKYKTVYMRELLLNENPQTDIKVIITNTYCNSRYGNENYRTSILASRLYYLPKTFTNKQVHYKIYSFFSKYYTLANYEEEIIKAQPENQTFRLLCIQSSSYSYHPCQYCGKSKCEGCMLKYNDEPFRDTVKGDKISMEIYWRKNVEEIKQKFEKVKNGKSDMEDENGDSTFSKPAKAGTSIDQCFKLFSEPETLGEENAWYCPKCKDFVLAKKQMQIYKAPKILVLCLKRFKRKDYHAQKFNIYVDYPVTDFNLSEYVLNPDLPTASDGQTGMSSSYKPVYDLIGVSNHFGSTGGGHYTAYCKDIYSEQWYDFDDSSVSSTKGKDIVSQAGYILFYRRKDADI